MIHMYDEQDRARPNRPQRDEPFLLEMGNIRLSEGVRVIEGPRRCLETDAVLLAVRAVLCLIPGEGRAFLQR